MVVVKIPCVSWKSRKTQKMEIGIEKVNTRYFQRKQSKEWDVWPLNFYSFGYII